MKGLKPALFLVCALGRLAGAQDKVNQSSLVLKDFAQRVADYVKIHKIVTSEIHGLKPTESPEAIEHHERKLAHGIREARRTARQGDIFTPEIAAEFRRLIAGTMKAPDGPPIRASLKHAEPVALRQIRVNGSYPAGVPLQSSPPSLLLNLPHLPPELEYRLAGHTLILRDIEANLIVDFLPDVTS